MASVIINHTQDSQKDPQTTAAVTVGAGEKVAVRLSRLDKGASCALKISGNSVVTTEPITRMNTVFDAIPENHEASVVTRRRTSSGGVEGVLESYS